MGYLGVANGDVQSSPGKCLVFGYVKGEKLGGGMQSIGGVEGTTATLACSAGRGTKVSTYLDTY